MSIVAILWFVLSIVAGWRKKQGAEEGEGGGGEEQQAVHPGVRAGEQAGGSQIREREAQDSEQQDLST